MLLRFGFWWKWRCSNGVDFDDYFEFGVGFYCVFVLVGIGGG